MLDKKTGGDLDEIKKYFEVDKNIKEIYPISDIPAKSHKKEWIKIWEGENMSYLEYKGKLLGRKVEVIFPLTSDRE